MGIEAGGYPASFTRSVLANYPGHGEHEIFLTGAQSQGIEGTMMDVAGKKALVTGANRGLGRAFAEALLEAGCIQGLRSATRGSRPFALT
jgi:hypothetical protein